MGLRGPHGLGVDSRPDIRGCMGCMALWGRRLGLRGLGAPWTHLVLARRPSRGRRLCPEGPLFVRGRSRPFRSRDRRSIGHWPPSRRCGLAHAALGPSVSPSQLLYRYAFRRWRSAAFNRGNFNASPCFCHFEPRSRPGTRIRSTEHGGRAWSSGSAIWHGPRLWELCVDAPFRDRRYVRGFDVLGSRAGVRLARSVAFRRSLGRRVLGECRRRAPATLVPRFGAGLLRRVSGGGS